MPTPTPMPTPTTTTEPGGDPVAPITAADAVDAVDAVIPLLVPPGFTPPAAALLVLAVGTMICLGGGRHLRVLLALAGGTTAGLVAWAAVPPAVATPDALLPVAGAAAGGGLLAAAAARFLATLVLALSLSVMAPAIVVSWDAMAAPHLADPARTAEAPAVATIHQAASRAAAGFPTTSLRTGAPEVEVGSDLARALPEDARLRAATAAGADAITRAGLDRALAGSLDELASDVADRLAGVLAGVLPAEPPPNAPEVGRLPHLLGAGPDRAGTLALLALAGAATGLGLGLTRAELAARAATASTGAILVLVGGLHLPAGLVSGGWIGPSEPEPVLVAWIALAILGATLQWRYRPPLADIGR